MFLVLHVSSDTSHYFLLHISWPDMYGGSCSSVFILAWIFTPEHAPFSIRVVKCTYSLFVRTIQDQVSLERRNEKQEQLRGKPICVRKLSYQSLPSNVNGVLALDVWYM